MPKNPQQQIEDALNKSLLSFLKARLPDRLFTINFQGDIAVNSIDAVLERTETAAAGGQPVAGYWRRIKGRWIWTAPHNRQTEMPSVMETALLEEKEEDSPTLGFSIQEVVQEFLQMISQPNSLQRFL